MTTWTSKHIAALGITAMLGACTAQSTDGLFSSLTSSQDAALPPVPLKQAKMMRGNVTLVPPLGYCIDPETLTQSFALLARCDALGAATGGAGAPAGVLTVSFARAASPDAALPTALDIATAAGLDMPQDIQETPDSIVFSATGPVPAAALAPRHWRSVMRIDGFMMGAALFGPEGRRAVSPEGAELLQELMTRTSGKAQAG